MIAPFHLLVLAKAPVAGRVKTRLGADIGLDAAAELASAALLDTLETCARTAPGRCHLALSGALEDAVAPEQSIAATAGWSVRPQVDGGLGERIAHAVGEVPGPVVQIGMDTPQVTSALLLGAAAALEEHDAVLGPAADGGWWVLALREPAAARALVGLPMSTPTTYDDTRAALVRAGLTVAATATLRDVDTVADAELVAAEAPETRFARVWTPVRTVSSTGSGAIR